MTSQRGATEFTIHQTRKNIASTYAARIVGLGSLIVVLPLILNAFGAEAAALYLLISTVVALLQTDLGLMAGGVRSIGRSYANGDDEQLATDVATSHAFFAGLTVVSSALYLGVFVFAWGSLDVSDGLQEDGRLLIGLGVAQLVTTIAATSVRQVLIAVGRLDLANGIVITQSAMRLFGCVLITQFDVDVWTVGCVDAVVAAAALLASIIVRHRVAPECAARLRSISVAAGRSMLKVNASLLVLAISGLIVMQAGSLVVSTTLPLVAVTAYAAGFRCYQACKEITNSLTAALLPAATRLDAEGRISALRDIYLKATGFAGAVQLAVVIPVMIFAGPILEIWLGTRLDGASSVAVWLLLSLIVSNNHLIAIPLLTARARVGGYALLHTLWAVSAVAIGVLLCPRMGPEGMAIGFCLPIVLLEVFYLRIAFSELDISVLDFASQVLRPILIPSILSLGTCATVAQLMTPERPPALLLATGVAAAAFLLSYWFVGLNTEERMALKHHVRADNGETTP